MRTEDQSSTLGFPIFADDSTAIGTGKTGLTITATLAKNGGTANAVSPTITELGNGIYWVTPIAAHRDTIGCNVWQFAATGAVIAPVFERIRFALESIIADAAAAKMAAQSADGKLTAGRLSRVDALPTATAGTTGGLALHGATGGGGDAEQATLLGVQETVDSIAVALAGSAPVEPTGTTVFQHLEQIQDSIDTYVSSALATVNGTQDTIVGFPDSLTVGDSYTEDSGNAIHVFIRDGNDDPISSVGSHGFTDSDFTPELVITNSGNAGRVRATVTYIDPGSSEPYLKVEIPLAESRRAAPGSATMQCVLKWNGCAKTLATQSVTWVARI